VRYPLLRTMLLSFRYPSVAEIILARNVANIPDIDTYVSDLSALAGDEENLQKWLKANLKNYLVRDFDEVRPVKEAALDAPSWMKKAVEKGDLVEVKLDAPFKSKIAHVMDWLKSDDKPERLERLTVPEAIKQSQDWTDQLHKKKLAEDPTLGEKLIKQYPDGVSWKELTSEAALILEGKKMNHCVGGSTYINKVMEKESKIWSLRDSSNNPQCTVELEGDHVLQMKGYGDGPIKPEFTQYVKDLLRRKNPRQVRDLENVHLYALDNRIVDLEDIKKEPKLAEKKLAELIGKEKSKAGKPTLDANGVTFSLHVYDMLTLLEGLKPDGIEPDHLKNLIDADYFDSAPGMEYEDVSSLLDSIEKKHPKTYKKMMALIKKVEEESEDEFSDNKSGKWLLSHESEVPEIYQAAQDAVSDGWSVGTADAAVKYVEEQLLKNDPEWESGSSLYSGDKGNIVLNLSWKAVLDGELGDSTSSSYGGRGSRRSEGFESEFNEEAATDRFYAALQENNFAID
jgi:hypothetical protein